MEMEEDCLASAYTTVSYSLHNSVLQLAQHCLTACTTLSYILHNTVLQLAQHCLTTCTTLSYSLHNSVLHLICGKVGVFPGYLKLLFTKKMGLKPRPFRTALISPEL